MRRARGARPTVVVAGLGDTGVMVATRLSRRFRVVGIGTRPALVSGQELGTRLTDLPRWKRTYLVPIERFRRLDAVEFVHGRVVSVDFAAATVTVEIAGDGGAKAAGGDGARVGATREVAYDAFVISTGVANGFWRNDRVESVASVDASMREVEAELARASTIAVVGGGATGVSVAYNLARSRGAGGSASTSPVEVHLFHSGDEPLPDFHPDSRSWIARELRHVGVHVHPNHRATLPAGFHGERLTSGTIEFDGDVAPFTADAILWAVGAVRPLSSFLPSSVLDDAGFVRVDDELRVLDASGARVGDVFAVGDVAASDPLRSSARNWGHRVVVANVTAALRGRGRVRTFRPAPYRWGSILGLQDDGLTVISAKGKRTRVPRPIAQRLLLGAFVQRVLYGGLRRGGSGRG